MTQFYIFKRQPNYNRLYGYPFGESKFEPKCEVCGRPSVRPTPPLAIRFEKRVTIADFVFSPPEVLVVDDVKQTFEAESIKGIEFLDVKVHITESNEELRAKLWHLNITGRAHAAPEMNIVPIEHCSTCGITQYSTWDNGVAIDESTWDGSDFLRLHEDVVGVLVTEKIRNIVKYKGFTGVELIPAEEYKDPFPDSRPRPRTGFSFSNLFKR